jgi:hypothetical protein
MALSEINRRLLRFNRRSERSDSEKLAKTFVNVGGVDDILSTSDNRIVFGRRGTGKTHAFKFRERQISKSGDLPVYIDLRTMGSDTSVQSFDEHNFQDRSKSLLIDLVQTIHETLLEHATRPGASFDFENYGGHFDGLLNATEQIRIEGPITESIQDRIEEAQSSKSSSGLRVSSDPSVNLSQEGTAIRGSGQTRTRERSGRQFYAIHFATMASALKGVCEGFGGKRVWVLLDEWSSLPENLQPYLADFLRRVVYPINLVTVQIAAIEQRSNFILRPSGRDYIGFEVGADVTADVDLDDLMVFDNDEQAATEFFSDLIFQHFRSEDGAVGIASSKEALVQGAFTQVTAFNEFVRASEGVPRDAINLLSLAARKASEGTISTEIVRTASRDWFQSDKSKALPDAAKTLQLLRWLIDEVIKGRKARAFLLRADREIPEIEELFDARLLHVLKRSVSAKDEPGARYRVFKLDYGCYVDLMNTKEAPKALLSTDSGDPLMEVPEDDYRAIRRAILKKEDIEKFLQQVDAYPTRSFSPSPS